MDQWKRFVNWCQQPSKIKINNFNPRNFAVLITLSIILASSITFGAWNLNASTQTIPPTLPPELPAVDSGYNPGVSVGDYVIYGNFVCKYDHQANGEDVVCIDDLAFWKVEVIEVSGTEVTFLHTVQYKSGSAAPATGCTETLDVEAAWWSNDTDYYIDWSWIIAANLNEGDVIHLGECDVPDHQVVRIEERTYLGSSRNVIPLLYAHSESGDNYHIMFNEVTVYDQQFGIRLERSITSDGDVVWAMSIIETNIFSINGGENDTEWQVYS